MKLNSYMTYVQKILLFIICTCVWAEMLPENGTVLNYTQIFFQWDQIPGAESYQFTIEEIRTGEEYALNIAQNSVLLTEFMDWTSDYIWFICGLFADDNTPFCSEIYTLEINPLPANFPDYINISNYDESLTQEGITVMDFESLDFSGSLEKDGTPIWFVDKNNFEDRFLFTQFLKNGNMAGFGPGKGYEIDLNGNILFETPNGYNVHHDFNKTSNNTYFLVSATVEDHYCPEECNPSLPDEIPWQGDIFMEIDSDGNEIWSWLLKPL